MAFDFDDAEYITIADNAVLDFGPGCSIGLYIQNDTLTTGDSYQYLLARVETAYAAAYSMGIFMFTADNGTPSQQGRASLTFFDSGGTQFQCLGATQLFKNTRRHALLFEWDDTADELRVYVDGALDGTLDVSTAASGVDASTAMYVGGRSDLDADRFARCIIGDVFQIDRLLTTLERRQHAGFIDPTVFFGESDSYWHLPLYDDDTAINTSASPAPTVDNAEGGDVQANKFRIVPSDHLHINSFADVETVRKQVISDLWRDGGGIPTAGATSVDLTDETYLDYLGTEGEIFSGEDQNIYALFDHVELYTVTTDGEGGNDDTVGVWCLVPATPANPQRLVVYPFGHGVAFTSPREQSVVAALAAGCHVLLPPMPHGGTNNSATILTYHDTIGAELTAGFNPMAYFLNPTIRGINEAISQHGGFHKIGIAGVSGGGWTAAIAAAVDRRIKVSLSCASNFPEPIRGSSKGWAPLYSENNTDYEQTLGGLTHNGSGELSFLDVHILAASAGRKHYQIYNALENVLGGYRGYQYRADVIAAASAAGGTFDMFFDHDETVHTMNTSWTAGLFMPELLEPAGNNYTLSTSLTRSLMGC